MGAGRLISPVRAMAASLSGLWLLATLLVSTSAKADPPMEEGTLTLSDGSTVGLLRAHPAASTGAHPVLLIPDFGLAPEVFSFRERGLLHALVDAGREVVVLDWRRTSHVGGLTSLVSQVLPAAILATAGSSERPVDVVAHGYAGSLVLAASVVESAGRIGRVVALSTPVELQVPSPMLERMLASGGALRSLSLQPEGLRSLELLLADGGQYPTGFWNRIRRAGLLNLPPRVAADLLAWMREGTLRLGEGDTLTSRLARYDRPTLLFLPLGDNLAHPEHAAPLRELSPRAAIQLLQLSRFDLMSEDYAHLSMLQGRDAPRDVWAPALRFLAGEAP